MRGTGIAERTHEYVATKMKEGKAIIALCGNDFAGFTYIESWGNKQYVATSGLIVHPQYRGCGLAKRIKHASFTLARLRWPKAKIFSLTSGAAVMKMNTELGYVPVTSMSLPTMSHSGKDVKAVSTTKFLSLKSVNSVSVLPCFTIRLCTQTTK